MVCYFAILQSSVISFSLLLFFAVLVLHKALFFFSSYCILHEKTENEEKKNLKMQCSENWFSSTYLTLSFLFFSFSYYVESLGTVASSLVTWLKSCYAYVIGTYAHNKLHTYVNKIFKYTYTIHRIHFCETAYYRILYFLILTLMQFCITCHTNSFIA